MHERRNNKRMRHSLEAWFRAGNSCFHRTSTFDLGAGGLALFAPPHLRLNERVDVTLRLETGRYITLRGRTCWRRSCASPDQYLVGLRFENDLPADRSVLQRWLGCQFLVRFAEKLAAYSAGGFRMPAWL